MSEIFFSGEDEEDDIFGEEEEGEDENDAID